MSGMTLGSGDIMVRKTLPLMEAHFRGNKQALNKWMNNKENHYEEK